MVNIFQRAHAHLETGLIRIDNESFPLLYAAFQEMMANSGGGGASYDAYEIPERYLVEELECILSGMTPEERSLFVNGSDEQGDLLDKSNWTPTMHRLDEFLDNWYEDAL